MSNEARECGLFIAVGSKGVGKTFRTLLELKEILRTDETTGRKGRNVLILDANNEFSSFTAINYNVLEPDEHTRTQPIRDLQGKLGIYRIAPFRVDRRPMSTNEIKIACVDMCNHFRFGTLVLEDYNRYINGSEAEELVSMLVTLRHRAVDCWIHLQSASPISTRLWQNVNYVRFHKINDSVDRYKNRIPYELIKIVQLAVDSQYNLGNKRYFIYVAILDEKIIGMDSNIFENACMSYLAQNKKVLTSYRNALSMSGEYSNKMNTNDKAVANFISDMRNKYFAD
jgi:hypothetical protein